MKDVFIFIFLTELLKSQATLKLRYVALQDMDMIELVNSDILIYLYLFFFKISSIFCEAMNQKN